MRNRKVFGIIVSLVTIFALTVSAQASDLSKLLEKSRLSLSVRSGNTYFGINSGYSGSSYSISHMNSCPGGKYIYRSERIYVPGRTVRIHEYRHEFNATCNVDIHTPGRYEYYGYYDWVPCGCIHYEQYYHHRNSNYRHNSSYRSPSGVPSRSHDDRGHGRYDDRRGSSSTKPPVTPPSTIQRPSKPSIPRLAPMTAPKGSILKSKSEVESLKKAGATTKSFK
jgi:hypothetical protein